MYLRRQAALRNYYTATRSTNSEEREVATGERKEQASLLPPLRQSLFLLILRALTGPIRSWRVLITMVDNGIHSGSYLYDLFRTNVGGRRSATETTQTVIQIDFWQKLVKCFYSERKAIKTQMCLTYKEINNTDNTVRNLVRSVTNRFILRNFGHIITHKYYEKLGSLVDLSLSIPCAHRPERRSVAQFAGRLALAHRKTMEIEIPFDLINHPRQSTKKWHKNVGRAHP